MIGEINLNGIILSGQPVGEYDKRLVILTAERGKIACFARGARKPTSSLSGTTRTFAFGSFVVYEGRSTYNLHRADIKNYFEDVITDIDSVLYACYFSEIADYYAYEGMEAYENVNLLYAAFTALSDKRLNKKNICSAYQIKAVYDAGECPPLERLFTDPFSFSIGARKAFDYITENSAKNVFKFTLGEKSSEELALISKKIIDFAIDKKLKSRNMLPFNSN